MQNAKPLKWDPDILTRHSIYAPLSPWHPLIQAHRTKWPTLAELQSFIEQLPNPIYSHNDARIRLVEQGPVPNEFADQYEPRIYLRGEIQTRTQSWHDLFQVLVWCSFPATKTVLNKRHYQQSLQRWQCIPPDKRRSPIENALTLFDECGAILVSSQPQVFEWISDHAWEKLFWEQRDTLEQEFKCFVFGHAIYEKAVAPYVGMTAKAIFVQVDSEFFSLPLAAQLTQLDHTCAITIDAIQSPQALRPFPLLGIPGWHPDNQSAAFYRNRDYFRPGK